MLISLKQLKDFFISSPKNGDVLAYNSTTKKWFNKTPSPKIWTGSTTVSGGAGRFTINYAAAGFVSAPMVFAQARIKDTTTSGRNFASIEATSATTASGYASNSLTAGLLLTYVMTNAADGTVINIVAIGD